MAVFGDGPWCGLEADILTTRQASLSGETCLGEWEGEGTFSFLNLVTDGDQRRLRGEKIRKGAMRTDPRTRSRARTPSSGPSGLFHSN